MTAQEFNVEFCRALGLNPDEVMCIDLKLRVGMLPAVVVTFAKFDEDEVLQLVRLFHLEEDEIEDVADL